MRLHVYRGAQLEGVFEYDQTSAAGDDAGRHGEHHAIAAPSSATSLADVPSEWLHWAAAIVFPALARGAFVRWES